MAGGEFCHPPLAAIEVHLYRRSLILEVVGVEVVELFKVVRRQ